jgi:hypothetical protein
MLDNSVASVCSIMSLNNESDCFSIARAIAFKTHLVMTF